MSAPVVAALETELDASEQRNTDMVAELAKTMQRCLAAEARAERYRNALELVVETNPLSASYDSSCPACVREGRGCGSTRISQVWGLGAAALTEGSGES